LLILTVELQKKFENQLCDLGEKQLNEIALSATFNVFINKTYILSFSELFYNHFELSIL